jgi:coproporphyrinogen III oxidase-like Fe-S oxidoreductase
MWETRNAAAVLFPGITAVKQTWYAMNVACSSKPFQSEVADRLAELALAIEICSAICPYCDMHQIFTGFSSMIAFTCRHCGEGVAVREVT